MKKLILISALLLFASNGWAYNETDLIKLKALNACEGCDLSGVNLTEANLSYAKLSIANLRHANLYDADLNNATLSGIDLTTANLRDANLDDAKFCKTKMPWGELNDDCENAD